VPSTFALAVALAEVAAGAGDVTGVVLADDAGADASPDAAEDDEGCEQPANPAAPASNAQPARTDLRIVEDMGSPSHDGTSRQLYALSPIAASPVRQARGGGARGPMTSVMDGTVTAFAASW
jgi:hypothetical protein